MLKYMITSPNFSLSQTKEAIIKHSPDFVCWRNKERFDKEELKDFASFAKKYSKVLINFDDIKDDEIIELFDGIHFPSSKIDISPKFDNILKFASTHNIDEIYKAIKNKIDYITLSPLFYSKNRNGLGVEKFNKLCIHPRTFALGGIVSEKEVNEVKKTKAIGFASIRYFYN
ncbi:MAG: thiamine phosphate synthase [Epsilonproteobacteria bacterium]|nr:thiamine phosphate synthase [Campylobacterota bacterium]